MVGLFFVFTNIDESYFISSKSFGYKKILAFIIPIKSWKKSKSEYYGIVGKRYYSYFSNKKNPDLVLEVSIRHKEKPEEYSVLLARFIKGRDRETFEYWKDYWYRACIFFEMQPYSLVNRDFEKLDLARIEFLEGDGGAEKFNK